MKKLIVAIAVLLMLLPACKKIFNVNQNCLISSEFVGTEEIKYIWEDEKQLIEMEFYQNGSLNKYSDIAWSGDLMQTINSYDASGNVVSQTEMYYDYSDRLEVVDFYTPNSSGVLEKGASYQFEYPGDDIKRYSYATNGNLVAYHYFHRTADKSVYQMDYMALPADTLISSSLIYYDEVVKNPFFGLMEYTIAFAPNSEFLASEMNTTLWNGQTSKTLLTDFEVNEKDYPISLTYEVSGASPGYTGYSSYTYHNCD